MPMVRRWHQELHFKPYHRKYSVGSEMHKLNFFIYDIDTKPSNIKPLSCYNCIIRELFCLALLLR